MGIPGALAIKLVNGGGIASVWDSPDADAGRITGEGSTRGTLWVN